MFRNISRVVGVSFACAFTPLAVMEAQKATDETDEDPNISIISGASSRTLATNVCAHLDRKLSRVDIANFSDGEKFINIHESMRGKDVFIIQSCAPPVNDSVVELLLTIGAAKRSGASTVTAIIPYFGYKLNRRGLPISTTHHSRFLWSAAEDLAKMILEMGGDKVVSVDLQRPGQGHEACFFKTKLPAETISTHDLFTDYFNQLIPDNIPLVIVSPNMELVKKTKKFQDKLKSLQPEKSIECGVFIRSDSDNSYLKGSKLDFEGDVKGKDVILIEDYIDSTVHISILCNRLVREGANRVFVCASHGLFLPSSMDIINLCPVTKIVVSDSIALPAGSSPKIVQLSLAPLLAKVIKSDLSTATSEFNHDVEEDQFVPE